METTEKIGTGFLQMLDQYVESVCLDLSMHERSPDGKLIHGFLPFQVRIPAQIFARLHETQSIPDLKEHKAKLEQARLNDEGKSVKAASEEVVDTKPATFPAISPTKCDGRIMSILKKTSHTELPQTVSKSTCTPKVVKGAKAHEPPTKEVAPQESPPKQTKRSSSRALISSQPLNSSTKEEASLPSPKETTVQPGASKEEVGTEDTSADRRENKTSLLKICQDDVDIGNEELGRLESSKTNAGGCRGPLTA